MRSKTVKIPIYFGRLKIFLVEDWAALSKKYPVTLTDDYCAVVFKNEGKNVLELIVAFKDKPAMSVIAHEAVHLVNHVFIHTCTTLDPMNDEPQAYLTGWFVQQIDNFINKT